MDKSGAAEGRDDDELSVPRAALNKMIKELIPRIRVANDARELILNCCTEFIRLVSSEANEICVKQQKKTISPDHVLEGNGEMRTMLPPPLVSVSVIPPHDHITHQGTELNCTLFFSQSLHGDML